MESEIGDFHEIHLKRPINKSQNKLISFELSNMHAILFGGAPWY